MSLLPEDYPEGWRKAEYSGSDRKVNERGRVSATGNL